MRSARAARVPVSVPIVEPELVEPEPVLPELIEPEVVPVVPELIEFVLPEVPLGLVVALPDEVAFGFEVEPGLTVPLPLLTPGPEFAELPEVDVPSVEPLVPVPPVPPPVCA